MRKHTLPPGPAAVVNGINISEHTGLVHKAAGKVWRGWGCQTRAGLEYDDLVSAGLEGLLVAARKWQPERGLQFSTHATWWIRHHLGRRVENESRTVRVPVHLQHSARKQGQRLPALQHAISLDAPLPSNDNDSAITRGDMLTYSERGPFVAPDAGVDRDRLLAALDTLPERERRVLLCRYWGDRTLAEVGGELGLSRERIRQLERVGLVALRRALGSAAA